METHRKADPQAGRLEKQSDAAGEPSVVCVAQAQQSAQAAQRPRAGTL